MSYTINRDSGTGNYIVRDSSGKFVGGGFTAGEAINEAVASGMPNSYRETLAVEAEPIQQQASNQAKEINTEVEKQAEENTTSSKGENQTSDDSAENEDPFEKARLDAEARSDAVPPTEVDVKEASNTDETTSGTGSKTTSQTKAANKQKNNTGQFLRQHNPLGDFSSYTYKLSLYGYTPEVYNNYKRTGYFDKNDMYLLVQSGGINNKGSDSSLGKRERIDSARAPGFDLDFYLDNLEIDTYTMGQESGVVSNSLVFKFQVIEPFGITFPTKLVENQAKLQKLAQIKRPVKEQIEAMQGHLMMVISFYGYDNVGKLVTSSTYNTGGPRKMDPQAAFERAFPIIITKFNFKLDGKATVYNIEARLVNEQVAMGVKRGVVDVPVAVSGSTVKEMLGGYQGSITGLIDQLNKQQRDQKESNQISIPDEYEIKFETGAGIAEGKLVDENLVKEKVPLYQVSNIEQVNDRASVSSKASTMTKEKTLTITSGTPITQAIDQIISQSDYVTKALTVMPLEDDPAKEDDPDYKENPNPKTLQWYIVVPQSEVIGYDEKRNDYAYRLTYVVRSYSIPYVRSTNIAYVPKYPGAHKKYRYYYTGKNSEIISYEQNYNLLYFNASAATSDGPATNVKDSAPNKPKAAQGADSTGLPSGVFDTVNTIKSFLYSPKDQLSARIKIFGDPDFLMPATSAPTPELFKKLYGNDFTINPNSGQVFIEIYFQQVEDYDIMKGVMEPNGDLNFWEFSKSQAVGSLIKGMVYMVTKVTSNFSKGQFTQEFKLAIPNFSELSQAGSDKVGGASNTSKTDTQREPTNQSVDNGGRSSTVPTYNDYDIPVEPQFDTAAETDNLAKRYPPPTPPNDDENASSTPSNVEVDETREPPDTNNARTTSVEGSSDTGNQSERDYDIF